MARHKMNNKPSQSYGSVWSAGCSPSGDGQCDGYVYANGYTASEHCACTCHNAWDLPNTVAEVEVWHANLHRMPSDNRMQGVKIPSHRA